MKNKFTFGVLASLLLTTSSHAKTIIDCIANERNEFIRAQGWVKKKVNLEYRITIEPKGITVESSGADTLIFETLVWMSKADGPEIEMGNRGYQSTFNIRVQEEYPIHQLPSGSTVTAWLSRWHYNELNDDGVYLNWIDTATCRIK